MLSGDLNLGIFSTRGAYERVEGSGFTSQTVPASATYMHFNFLKQDSPIQDLGVRRLSPNPLTGQRSARSPRAPRTRRATVLLFRSPRVSPTSPTRASCSTTPRRSKETSSRPAGPSPGAAGPRMAGRSRSISLSPALRRRKQASGGLRPRRLEQARDRRQCRGRGPGHRRGSTGRGHLRRLARGVDQRLQSGHHLAVPHLSVFAQLLLPGER